LRLDSSSWKICIPLAGNSHQSTAHGMSILCRFYTDSTIALERTFLGYFRTAVMSAVIGTLVAQLFTLEQQDNGFGYSAIGRPLSTACFCLSIITISLGACRTWRHQHAMISGKALTGGFEITILTVGFLAVSPDRVQFSAPYFHSSLGDIRPFCSGLLIGRRFFSARPYFLLLLSRNRRGQGLGNYIGDVHGAVTSSDGEQHLRYGNSSPYRQRSDVCLRV
jgi:uncharacterized membrane protein YidH (DUF202 family)